MQRALSHKTSKVSKYSLSLSVSPPSILSSQDHLLTITLPTWRPVSWKTWTMTILGLFPIVTNEHPFQDHLLSRTVPMSWETLTVTVQSLSPSLTTKWPAISRPSPKCNSSDSKSFVPHKAWIMNMQSFYQCHSWMAILRPSCKLTSNDLKTSVLADLNNQCVESLLLA